MDLEQFRRQLRAATYLADGTAVVDVLRARIPPEGLQAAGHGLLVALAQHHAEAGSLAERCVAELRERGFAGDQELADDLGAALGRQPVAAGRPLAVDLEDLAEVLSSSPGAEPGILDTDSGEVWPPLPFGFDDDLDEDGGGDADGRTRLAVWPEGSDEAYRDMVDFIATIDEDDIADRLSIAIQRKGAFRRFRDVLDR